jgi:hypothetical protein
MKRSTPAPTPAPPAPALRLQRQCACGGAAGLSGRCTTCERRMGLGLQPELAVGSADEVFEREADRVADEALAQRVAQAPGGPAPSVRRLTDTSGAGAMALPQAVQQTLASTGSALEPSLRHDMERRFGHDFSQVRLHSDGLADQSAREVHANAYTAGRHIAFAAAAYAPQTSQGRRLLAHELTHVVQQAQGPTQRLQRDSKDKTPPPPKIVPPVEPGKTQKKAIDDARRAAAIRTQRAMFRTRGIEGAQALVEAQALARIKFDWPEPNMEQIGDVLAAMGSQVATVDIKVAGPGDQECGSRAGYVRGFRAPIVLCAAFFAKGTTHESRIRTLVHEMAHLQRIGSADGSESYFPVFDCNSPGSFESADAWANYVHCVSGEKPDANVVPRSKPAGARSGKKQ